MSRSLSKPPFSEIRLIKDNMIKIWSRRSTILPQFVGKTVSIHNGRIFIPCKISPEMIGHKFGEFAVTRKKPVHKKKK
ncbi:rms19 (mitochondrion) [Auxenochlorella protothecoides x Auxenochlorella symbiontica]|uniref:Small ribosomal subunit protein uS19m n=2 Tax=Auxenochlorella protothecoides TaxID=3075 RepID=A0A0A6ZEH1_AUXPR|nr:ribosomal protein S19 [Auxenochlorella protothecoides]AGN72433.1 ribosomal protein S19 [Auxenochlorella protothecoides]